MSTLGLTSQMPVPGIPEILAHDRGQHYQLGFHHVENGVMSNEESRRDLG